jgi:hypothetical protein
MRRLVGWIVGQFTRSSALLVEETSRQVGLRRPRRRHHEPHHRNYWLAVAGGAVTVGAALVGLSSAINGGNPRPSEYDTWGNSAMIVAYVLFAIGVAAFFCAIRNVPFPFAKASPAPPAPPPPRTFSVAPTPSGASTIQRMFERAARERLENRRRALSDRILEGERLAEQFPGEDRNRWRQVVSDWADECVTWLAAELPGYRGLFRRDAGIKSWPDAWVRERCDELRAILNKL